MDATGRQRPRGTQEVDDGRRGSGSVFGASVPAAGAALALPCGRRTTANRAEFLEQAEGWLDPGGAQVRAVLDALRAHRAAGAPRWARARPRWAFAFQPTHAAYPNPTEPWREPRRPLALKGRRFATRDAVCHAVEAAPRSRHAHRHPFARGRRKRRRPARPSGVARPPVAA